MQTYNLYLIFAEIEGIGQWKIGVSKHPEKRLLELSTANPNIKGISVIYEVETRELAYMIESRLKKKLEPFKINGEWVEHVALNDTLFIEYCKHFDMLCSHIIEMKNTKKENKKYENFGKAFRYY